MLWRAGSFFERDRGEILENFVSKFYKIYGFSNSLAEGIGGQRDRVPGLLSIIQTYNCWYLERRSRVVSTWIRLHLWERVQPRRCCCHILP